MTDERLPLAGLLAKASDGDFLRSVAEAVAELTPPLIDAVPTQIATIAASAAHPSTDAPENEGHVHQNQTEGRSVQPWLAPAFAILNQIASRVGKSPASQRARILV